MLNAGLDINSKDSGGSNALHSKMMNLFNCTKDKNIDDYKTEILHFLKIINFLSENKASWDIQDTNGNTPLHVLLNQLDTNCISSEETELILEVIEIAVRSKADFSLKNNQNQLVLDLANDFKIISKLMDENSLKDYDGFRVTNLFQKYVASVNEYFTKFLENKDIDSSTLNASITQYLEAIEDYCLYFIEHLPASQRILKRHIEDLYSKERSSLNLLDRTVFYIENEKVKPHGKFPEPAGLKGIFRFLEMFQQNKPIKAELAERVLQLESIIPKWVKVLMRFDELTENLEEMKKLIKYQKTLSNQNSEIANDSSSDIENLRGSMELKRKYSSLDENEESLPKRSRLEDSTGETSDSDIIGENFTIFDL